MVNLNCKEPAQKKLKCIFIDEGYASWYGGGFHGKKTASGIKFNKNTLSAAHKSIEFGTLVRVTNWQNNKSIIVEIVDRGPVSKRRIIDLSEKAAMQIGLHKKGFGKVSLEICGYREVNFKSVILHYRNIKKIKAKKLL